MSLTVAPQTYSLTVTDGGVSIVSAGMQGPAGPPGVSQVATVGPARMAWVTPVRAGDAPYTGTYAEFNGLSLDFDSRGLKSTWLARYDSLTDGTFGPRLDALRTAGHEIGVWLETCASQWAAAGVDFNASNQGVAQTPLYHVLRYGPDERRRLVDALMRAYYARYAAYPATVGFWLLDATTARYLRDRYGVRCLVFCRDQWQTDAEELQFGWRNVAREAAEEWFAAPAGRPGGARSGVCCFRAISVDLIANYGVFGSGDTPTHEPSAVARATGGKTVAGVWTPNIQDVADRPHAPPVVITPFEENGWSPTWDAANGTTIAARAALDSTLALAAAGTVGLKTCSQVAADFLAQATADRDRPSYLYQTADVWYGSPDRVLWYQGVKYAARTRWRNDPTSGGLGVTDLRVMDGADPYTAAVAGPGAATWRSPWVVDGGNYADGGARVGKDTINGGAVAALRVRTFTGTAADDYAATQNLSVSAVPQADGQTLTWTRGGQPFSLEYKPRGMVWSLAMAAGGSGQTLHLALTAATGADPQTQTYAVNGVPTSIHQTSSSINQTDPGVVADYLTVSYDNRDAAVIFYPLAKSGPCNWSVVTATAAPVEFGAKSTGAGAITCQIAVVPCRKSELAVVLALLASDPTAYLLGLADPVGPRLLSATVPAAGTTCVLTFDRPASDAGPGGWAAVASGGPQAMALASGNGTASLVYNLTRGVKIGEKLAVAYTPGGLADVAGNPAAPLVRWATVASSRSDGMPPAVSARSPQLWLAAGPDWCFTDAAKTTRSWGGGSRAAVWSAATGGDLSINSSPEDAVATFLSGGSWRLALASGHHKLSGSITATPSDAAIEVMALARFDATPGADACLFDMRDGPWNIATLIGQPGNTKYRVRNSTGTLRDIDVTGAPDGNFHVYGISADGSGVTAWKDGASVGTGAAVGGTFNFSRITVGNDDGGGSACVCSVWAVVLFPAVLTSQQRSDVVAALLALAS